MHHKWTFVNWSICEVVRTTILLSRFLENSANLVLGSVGAKVESTIAQNSEVLGNWQDSDTQNVVLLAQMYKEELCAKARELFG